MTENSKKIIGLIGVLLLAAASTVYGTHTMNQVREDSFYREKIGKIYDLSGVAKIEDFHKKIDALRVFINKNSQHLEDDEFHANWRDQDLLAGAFLDGLEKKRKDLPHMECSTRRGLMAEILNRQMNVKTRSVDLYHPSGDGLNSHSALDVWNPETKAWETVDPEYDVFWQNAKKQRITILDAAGDLKHSLPCNGRSCGWSIKSREGADAKALKTLTAYIVIIDKDKSLRMTYYSDAVDPKAVYNQDGGKGTYCEILRKNCRDGFMPTNAETIKKAEYAP